MIFSLIVLKSTICGAAGIMNKRHLKRSNIFILYHYIKTHHAIHMYWGSHWFSFFPQLVYQKGYLLAQLNNTWLLPEQWAILTSTLNPTLTLTPTLNLTLTPTLTLNPTLATAHSPLLGEKPCIVQFSQKRIEAKKHGF